VGGTDNHDARVDGPTRHRWAVRSRLRRVLTGLSVAVGLAVVSATAVAAERGEESRGPRVAPGASSSPVNGVEWGADASGMGELVVVRHPDGSIFFGTNGTQCGGYEGRVIDGSGRWTPSSFSGTGHYQSGEGMVSVNGSFTGTTFSGSFSISVPPAPIYDPREPGFPGCNYKAQFSGECVRLCRPALQVEITSANPDAIVNARNDGTYFSIPSSRHTNRYQRTYRVKYRVLKGTTNLTTRARIKRLTVDLDSAGGEVLQANVVDAGIGPVVRRIAPGTLKVRVTFRDRASTVAAAPPPADEIAYSFSLEVEANGESAQSNPYKSDAMHALWKMPSGLARFGPCDQATHEREGPGGDEWVSLSTYEWMQEHGNLLTAINDASFEHGLNLGPHHTHATGTDIDMFHVYALPNASKCSGSAYYDTLAMTMEQALGERHTSPLEMVNARHQMTSWVTATRAKFDELLKTPRVSRIIYACGAEARQAHVELLHDGWAKALLRTGEYGALDLHVGTWANGDRISYADDHDNHIHLALAPIRVKERCPVARG
jgi:hypothetical protein